MIHHEPLITVRVDGKRYVWPSTAEFMAARMDRTAGPDGCWPWLSIRNKKGYGLCTSSPRTDSTGSRMAHRISYEVANGPIPDGLRVLHQCDNPSCCNPAHLFLGTLKDNTQDMLRKGRGVSPLGLGNGNGWITDDQVREVHRMHEAGASYGEIADQIGTVRDYVGQIVRGEARKTVLLDDHGCRFPSKAP